jgi:hypothetical protein
MRCLEEVTLKILNAEIAISAVASAGLCAHVSLEAANKSPTSNTAIRLPATRAVEFFAIKVTPRVQVPKCMLNNYAQF